MLKVQQAAAPLLNIIHYMFLAPQTPILLSATKNMFEDDVLHFWLVWPWHGRIQESSCRYIGALGSQQGIACRWIRCTKPGAPLGFERGTRTNKDHNVNLCCSCTCEFVVFCTPCFCWTLEPLTPTLLSRMIRNVVSTLRHTRCFSASQTARNSLAWLHSRPWPWCQGGTIANSPFVDHEGIVALNQKKVWPHPQRHTRSTLLCQVQAKYPQDLVQLLECLWWLCSTHWSWTFFNFSHPRDDDQFVLAASIIQ